MFDSFETTWTVVCQAPLFMGLFRQGYWSGLPFPSPGDLPNTEIECASPASAGRFFTNVPPKKPYIYTSMCEIDPGEGRPGSLEAKSTLLVPQAHRDPPGETLNSAEG